MSLLDELGFQQIDPDTQGIVDLDLLDLSVDIEVTTLNSHLGIGMEDIKPVDAIFPEIFLQQVTHDQGIEATDVGSLLEQFEEKASQNFEGSKSEQQTEQQTCTKNSETNNNSDVKDKNVVSQPDASFLTKEFLERIQRLRAEKKKKTVMLPMVVPAKRGRGRAMTRGHPVALPASCTPLRLQRVVLHNQDLREYVPFSEENASSRVMASNHSAENEKDVLNDKSNVIDSHQEIFTDHDYFRKDTYSPPDFEGKGLDLEEGEVIEDEENFALDIKPDKAKLDKRLKRRGNSPVLLDDDSQYFDKLPSYCTALSIPQKQTRKTAANVTRRGGLRLHDYIARDNSPVRDTTDSAYNRIPNYYFSFTNSTKYDSLNIDTCKSNDDNSSGKDSSGYSSLSQSVQDSDSSPTRSRSQSHSRSRSRSVSQTGGSPSRRFHSRSRKGNYRRQSSCSPSSVGSSSRSCSRSSCSGCESRSCSRSCSVSSSRSNSCSSCCSRSSVGSSPSRSRSRERSWQRERNFRAERVDRSRSHSGGRARRNRSKLSHYSRSRSRDYRSRSRSCSPSREHARKQSRERRREAKKQEREEEKDKQMKERRIVYVGGIPSNFTRHKLRGSFTRFGEIEHVQLHFREHGDNYGFVTFMYTCDAYAAIEKGKHLPELKAYDLCFGGRRQFCDVEYADLDGNKEVEEEFDPNPRKGAVLDFDELLRQARAGIKK